MAFGIKLGLDSPPPVEYDTSSKPNGIEADSATDPPNSPSDTPQHLAYSALSIYRPEGDHPLKGAMDKYYDLIEADKQAAAEAPDVLLPEHEPLATEMARDLGHTGINAVGGTLEENPGTQKFQSGPSQALEQALETVNADETSFTEAMNIFRRVDFQETEDTLTLLEAISDRYSDRLSDRERGRIDGLAESVVITARKTAIRQGTIEPADVENMARAVDISDGNILGDFVDTVELFEHPEKDSDTGGRLQISIDPTLAEAVHDALGIYQKAHQDGEDTSTPKLHRLIIIKMNDRFSADYHPSQSYGPKPRVPAEQSTQAAPAEALIS